MCIEETSAIWYHWPALQGYCDMIFRAFSGPKIQTGICTYSERSKKRLDLSSMSKSRHSYYVFDAQIRSNSLWNRICKASDWLNMKMSCTFPVAYVHIRFFKNLVIKLRLLYCLHQFKKVEKVLYIHPFGYEIHISFCLVLRYNVL